MDKQLVILFLSLFFVTNSFTQTDMKITEEAGGYLPAVEKYKSEIAINPAEYKLVYFLKDKINKEVVYIYRFEATGNPGDFNLHYTHITIIVDSKKRLKGFSQITESMRGENNLGDSECRQLALSFLKKYASDLKKTDFQWIDDQKISFLNTTSWKKESLNGKWVKFRDNETGYYLWVILAPDGSIMEFDRDIFWSFFRGGRVNELWLRDDWFGKRISK